MIKRCPDMNICIKCDMSAEENCHYDNLKWLYGNIPSNCPRQNIDEWIKEHRLRHRNHWREKSDWYWFWRILQEIVELFLSLLKLHKDTPDWEILQIATIGINWLEKREQED